MNIRQTSSASSNQPMPISHEVKIQDAEVQEPFLKKSLLLVPSCYLLENILCICFLTCFVFYGFISISVVSREHVFELNVGHPRWKWLSMFPFYSVGYNSNGDGQWKVLDQWLWLMIVVFAFFALGSRVVRWNFSGEKAVFAIQLYHITVGILYIAFIHGPCFYLLIVCVLLNYMFMALCVKFMVTYRVFMTLMWLSQVGALFLVGYYGKYLGFEDSINFPFSSWWPRRLSWTVTFNMAVLRMIAFNNDMYEGIRDNQTRHESLTQRHKMTCIECAQMREANLIENSPSTWCYKLRTECSRHPNDYNIVGYMAYMLYVPLYVAGPMSSFNAFVSYCKHTTLVMSCRQMVFYGLRIAGIYFTLVFMLHFAYVNAFRLFPNLFLALSVSQKAFICYFSLAFLWLKFSFVWKLSRLAAIIDGFDAPEDMRRCFSNTVSVTDFWRDWHASFNLWVVRYIYIPMGGNKKKHFNIFPVFFFIAIWHDIALHLVKWAACIVFIFILELVVIYLWSLPRFAFLRYSRYERLLRRIGGIFTIFGLIVANLIGFSSQARIGDGRETDSAIWDSLASAEPTFFFILFCFFYCVATLGIAIREREKENRDCLKKRYGLE